MIYRRWMSHGMSPGMSPHRRSYPTLPLPCFSFHHHLHLHPIIANITSSFTIYSSTTIRKLILTTIKSHSFISFSIFHPPPLLNIILMQSISHPFYHHYLKKFTFHHCNSTLFYQISNIS